jgi:glyoxylase-like metal-dependent hydrolase (beta-lactamase superfamily II)
MNTMSNSAASDKRPSVPTGPLEVRPLCWMVGYRNPQALLQCNTYVRSFEGAGSPVHVCVDPGSQFDYSVIESNIGKLIGDVGELHAFSLNHQDPDVIGNSQYLCDANPRIGCLVTEDVWRLAQHLLFKPGQVHFANAARSTMMIVGDQHRWQLVPTPFCHFRGAMAFYDRELRTLFSGDLFGGLNRLGRVHLVAEEADWAGVAQFHQIYMPTRSALRYAIRQIQSLSPAVEVIAPQHGHVVTGDLVPLFLERMYDLLVGHDLLAWELDESYHDGYCQVVRRLVAKAKELMGGEDVGRRLATADEQLAQRVRIADAEVHLEREGYTAVVNLLTRLVEGEPPETVNALRDEIMQACAEHEVPIPPIGVGLEQSDTAKPIGPDGIQTSAWWLPTSDGPPGPA